MSAPKSVTVINLGAGVQSSTLAIMAEKNMIGPKPDAAIFADTFWEPKRVYDHLDWLEQQLSFPVIRTNIGRRLRDDYMAGVNPYEKPFITMPVHVRNRDGSAGLAKQTCTMEYKIVPIKREIRKLMGISTHSTPKGSRAEQWIGISTDEIHRAKVQSPNYLSTRYPLIEEDMTRQDCFALWREWYGDYVPPKSSCIGCPWHDDKTWRDMQENRPDEYNDAAEAEAAARNTQAAQRFDGHVYLHNSLIPLGSIDWVNRPRQTNFFDDCEGYCMT